MNGIIINDELHELVSLRTSPPCDNCSLQGNCDKTDFFLCTIIAGRHKSDERFVSRGKVEIGSNTLLKDKEKIKNMCLRDKTKVCNLCHECDVDVLNPSY